MALAHVAATDFQSVPQPTKPMVSDNQDPARRGILI
jgi:hypothetical protein